MGIRVGLVAASLRPRLGEVALGLFLCAGAAGLAGAQGVLVALRGRVVDETGAGIPGAVVTVTGEDWQSQSAQTDAEGSFIFANLRPGSLRLKAELPGFKTLFREVKLRAGSSQEITLVMPFGVRYETVEVAASAAGPPEAPEPEMPVRWNAWMDAVGLPFKPVGHLRPGAQYELTVDLAAIAYTSQGVATRGVSTTLGDALEDWLDQNPEEPDPRLTVVLLPDARAVRVLGDQTATLQIPLAKLRRFSADGLDETPADPMAELARTPDPPFLFGRIRFTVEAEATFEGVANIGLSIWDQMRPVDELVVSFCVSKAERPDRCTRRPAIAETLKGIDAARLGAGQAERYPDLSLHLVEFPGQKIVAAMRRKGGGGSEFLTWPIRLPPNDFRERLKVLTRDLGTADGVADHLVTGEAIYSLLFPWPAAQEARGAFETFLKPLVAEGPFASASPPSVFVRAMLPSIGGAPLIPASFMAPRELKSFLGYHAVVSGPLPRQAYDQPQACISRWVIVIPPQGIRENNLSQAVAAVGGRNEAWKAGGAEVHSDLGRFRDWIGGSTYEDAPAVLAVLSHQDDDRLRFEGNNRVYADSMNRQFQNSVAILSACETAPPGPATLLRRLNDNGFMALIGTSSKVSPGLGGSMLRELAQVVESPERPQSETLAALFRLAQKKLWSTADQDGRIPSEVLKYTLVGNGGLTICRPTAGGPPGGQ